MCRFRLIAAALGLVLISCGKEDKSPTPVVPEPPFPPTNLQAEARSFNLISLSWSDNSSDEDGFIIERAAGDGPYSMSTPVAANTTTFLDSVLLIERTRYRYRAFAVRGDERSFPSNEAVVLTPIRPPSAPTLTGLEALSATSARLNWQDNSNDETGFQALRASGGQDIFHIIARTPANAREFVDSNLTEYSRWRYKVAAVKDTILSAFSQSLDITTPPHPPSELLAQTWSDSSLRLGWRDNSLVETGYRIERLNSAGDTWNEIAQNQANNTFYTDIGLAEWTRYHYRVSTLTATVSSPPCAPASAQTGLKSPAGLRAVRTSETSIQLNWQDRSSVEDGFEIERKDNLNREFQRIARPLPNATAFTDIGLTANTTYSYHIRTAKEGQYSIWSNEASATTSILRPPAPTGLQAHTTNSLEITLNWADNSANELGFIVEWKRWESIDWTFSDTVAAEITLCRVYAQDWRTRYQFRVCAYNENGRSDYSNIVEATTPDGPPQPPSEMRGTAQGYSSVVLTWRDNSTNETEFRLERMTGDDGNWAVIAILPANNVQYIDRDVMPLSIYAYRALAANQYGASNYSNTFYVVLPDAAPNPPSELRGIALNQTTAFLAWRDNSNDESGFTLERKILPDGQWAAVRDITANDTTFIDTGLTHTTTFAYRLQSFVWVRDSVYRSIWSNEAVVITSRDTIRAPSNLTAAVSGRTVRLNWRDNSDDELEFVIERSPWEQGQAPDFEIIGTTPRNHTSFIDSEIEIERMYGYRVKAIDVNRQSGYSNLVWAFIENTYVFYDGFEDYEVGQPPGGEWQDTTGGTSWVRVSDEMSNPAGGQSVQFHDPDDGANFCVLDLQHTPMAQGTLQFFIRLDEGGTFGVLGGDGRLWTTFNIIFRADRYVYARDANNFQSCGQYNSNEWLDIEVVFSMETQTYSLYINNALRVENLQLQRNDHPDNRFILFIAYIDAEISNCWVDEVILDTLQHHQALPRAPVERNWFNGVRRVDDFDLGQ